MRPTQCISRRLFVAMLCVLAVQVVDLAAGVEAAGPETTPAPRRISPDDAIARAINELEAIDGGFRLRNPSHTATFTADGVCFEPKRNGLLWQWRFSRAGGSDCELDGIDRNRQISRSFRCRSWRRDTGGAPGVAHGSTASSGASLDAIPPGAAAASS